MVGVCRAGLPLTEGEAVSRSERIDEGRGLEALRSADVVSQSDNQANRGSEAEVTPANQGGAIPVRGGAHMGQRLVRGRRLRVWGRARLFAGERSVERLRRNTGREEFSQGAMRHQTAQVTEGEVIRARHAMLMIGLLVAAALAVLFKAAAEAGLFERLAGFRFLYVFGLTFALYVLAVLVIGWVAGARRSLHR